MAKLVAEQYIMRQIYTLKICTHVANSDLLTCIRIWVFRILCRHFQCTNCSDQPILTGTETTPNTINAAAKCVCHIFLNRLFHIVTTFVKKLENEIFSINFGSNYMCIQFYKTIFFYNERFQNWWFLETFGYIASYLVLYNLWKWNIRTHERIRLVFHKYYAQKYYFICIMHIHEIWLKYIASCTYMKYGCST